MQVLAVHPSMPAKTVQELVALIKANPGKYSYASAGAGTGSHLTGELFRPSLELDLVHVPYGGGGPAIAATVAGHTPISLRLGRGGHSAAQGRQAARARGRRQDPTEGTAGRSDHARSRLSRRRMRAVVGRAGAGQDAEGDHHAAQSGDRRGGRAAGHAGAPDDARLRDRQRRRRKNWRRSSRPTVTRWANVIRAAGIKAN